MKLYKDKLLFRIIATLLGLFLTGGSVIGLATNPSELTNLLPLSMGIALTLTAWFNDGVGSSNEERIYQPLITFK